MKLKVAVYNLRPFDETEWFAHYAKELDIELVTCPDAPNLQNAALARGCLCVNVITSVVDRPLMEAFASCGVKYLVTRTIGYDHIDLDAAKEFGIRVGNAPYGPYGVADYTVMLILMSIRRMKRIMQRTEMQDYTLHGIQGRELRDLTVGVIGTGRIGSAVVQELSGFGCRILAHDKKEHETVRKQAAYVPLEQIWKEADVITLHMPLTEDNFHLINAENIGKMKDGVILINTARGSLIDTGALLDAIEGKKVGAAALDVVENEFGLYYYDCKNDILNHRELALLRSFPNVTVSHHMAFYTDNEVKTVIRDSLTGCRLFAQGKENPWQIV